MKHALISLFILAVLGGASAQSSEFIGIGLKAELGPAADDYFSYGDVYLFPPTFVEIQAGDYALFGSFGFREIIGTDFSDFLELSGDILVPLFERPTVYLGAGAGLNVGLSDVTVFNVHGVAGAEFGLFSHLGFFTEVNPGYYVASGQTSNFGSRDESGFGVKVRFGFNVHP